MKPVQDEKKIHRDIVLSHHTNEGYVKNFKRKIIFFVDEKSGLNLLSGAKREGVDAIGA